MTFEQCHARLVAIRRQQGTSHPAVRVFLHGVSYAGRLKRADSDPEARRGTASPFGVLVLESLGLCRGPETILQIASIPEDGIRDLATTGG